MTRLRSVVRASDLCTEGHGFDSLRGLRFFSLCQARDILNIPSFLTSYPSLQFTIFLYLSMNGIFFPNLSSIISEKCVVTPELLFGFPIAVAKIRFSLMNIKYARILLY